MAFLSHILTLLLREYLFLHLTIASKKRQSRSTLPLKEHNSSPAYVLLMQTVLPLAAASTVANVQGPLSLRKETEDAVSGTLSPITLLPLR